LSLFLQAADLWVEKGKKAEKVKIYLFIYCMLQWTESLNSPSHSGRELNPVGMGYGDLTDVSHAGRCLLLPVCLAFCVGGPL
jgi:hypothetical protein